MKIHSVKYYDNSREWGYDTIHFSDLTLLVGISGVGKTQILSSLFSLKCLADGVIVNDLTWEISFSNNGAKYFWAGEFKKNSRNIRKEILELNGEEVLKRNEDEVFYKGNKTIKLPPEKSLINLLKEEESVKKAFEGFEKIEIRDHATKGTSLKNYAELTFKVFDYVPKDVSEIEKKYKTLEEIRESDLDLIHKLYCINKNQKNTFNIIKERFIEIFRQVEDIEIAVKDDDMFSIINQIIEIRIKEKGVNKWISHKWMSSGMLRTFLHLSEMYLLKKGSVVLIDEFETSLGTNCINALAEDLMFENNDIQFIITSHHPYIINQIPYEYWKIVTRENGKIVTYNADEFNLGESHHERFMNLINLPKYKKGIVHA